MKRAIAGLLVVASFAAWIMHAHPGNGWIVSPAMAATNSGISNSKPDSGAPVAPPGFQQIQHVVIIFQENRSPDNLFHGLPNADIANSGLNSKGQMIQLTPMGLISDYTPLHTHQAFVQMWDNGKMDGADKIKISCNKKAKDCPPPNPQFKFVPPADVAPYFALAQQYTFGDRMFQTNQGPSFPAHQFIISGTSAPTSNSLQFAAENPDGVQDSGNNTGCTAPPLEFVWLIDPSGKENVKSYPCYEHPLLTDLLDTQNLSWRYYTPSAGSLWTGPNAIEHLCQPDHNHKNCTGPDWVKDVVLDQSRVLTDIANGRLAAVSWVIPSGQESDHAGGNEGLGPSWVASVVNAIGTSQYWKNTAILITWDDWGGWYDHVAPKIDATYGYYEYGFRVPLIVVSPFAKQGYVSHVTHDFGSILKFTEEVFGLPSLGYADARADDLSDCFNFNKRASTFHVIHAPHDANYFLNDKTPPTDPDDD